MTRGNLLALTLAVIVLALVGSVILFQLLKRQDRLAKRIHDIRSGSGEKVEPIEVSGPIFVRIISSLGTTIARSGLLSTRTITELEETLATAGFRRGHGLGLFVGSKLLLMAGLPGFAFLVLQNTGFGFLVRNGIVIGSAMIGLLGPDYAVRWKRKRYLKSLERGLPDALDLMVICTDSGLGLEPSIARVSAEIRHAHPSVSDELAQAASELRITADSRSALMNMGRRTGLENVKRLATTLTQSIQYGTPLSQALRTLSVELRQEMLTQFEARAARLPVLLTVPMIMFILPCVFVIVAGPAIVRVMGTMHQ